MIMFWKIILVVGDKEELEGKIKMKGMRSKVMFPDEVQIIMVGHVLLHELAMREVGIQAHLQGFNTTYTHNIITVHSISA